LDLISAPIGFGRARTKPQQFVRFINDLNEGDETNIVDLILNPLPAGVSRIQAGRVTD
jgi:hypothetical protein